MFAGNLDTAQSDYQNALALLPGYPLAIFGEGRIAYARGDLPTAITLLQTATAALPRPDMLAFLGDLYSLSGDSAKANDQFATVDFIASMTASSGAGHVYDREYGLFLSDHGRDVAQALTLAQDELAVRQDIYGYDAYAWALHANGRDAEALAAINKALALGTADAKLYLHAGLIEIANGQTDVGKAHLQQALALNPTISPLVVDEAHEGARSMRAARLALAFAISLAALALVVPATSAHPLGNFTINHYSGLRVSTTNVLVDHVMDFAEIPTFTERRAMDTDGDGNVSDSEANAYAMTQCMALASDLDLEVGGSRLALGVTQLGISFPMGQGNPTMRLVCVYSAPLASALASGTSISFTDHSFAERQGWREIVVDGDGR